MLHNWQELKQKEKDKKGTGSLWPACRKICGVKLQPEIQDRVAEVGFDWENDQGVMINWPKKWRI